MLASHRRRLPHARASGATYFVTWRLHAPARSLSDEERSIVAEALRHFDGQRYALFAFVVMDDHVHLLVTPSNDWALERLVHSWKSFSAHAIGQHRGWSGPIWQAAYFDRIVRDEDDLREKADYILRNPFKRWPSLDRYPWVWVFGQR